MDIRRIARNIAGGVALAALFVVLLALSTWLTDLIVPHEESPAPTQTVEVRVVPEPQPYCPTEDSCEIEYDGETHRWVITPVVP